MARPRKCRRVCAMPKADAFFPESPCGSEEPAVLTIEEFECIRLIDWVGLTQEECADFMQVSRTTAQQIYQDARKTLSRMLVEGRPLRIEGGTYELCDQKEKPCCSSCRHRSRE